MGSRSARHVVWYAFGLIVAGVGIYFGPQTIEYFRLRPLLWRPSDFPPRGWDSVCTPLTDTDASTAAGTVLSYYGYRFEVPWKNLDKERNPEGWVEVDFKTGQRVTFVKPGFFEDDLVHGFSVAADAAPHDFREAFGSGIRESRYEQFKEVISVRRSQLFPLHSRKEFARTRILLEVKGLWFEHNVAPPDVFTFKTEGYRGFEISGLSRDWQQVQLDLFDASDHWLRISIFGNARSGVRLTQPEINRIIQSFEPSPAR